MGQYKFFSASDNMIHLDSVWIMGSHGVLLSLRIRFGIYINSFGSNMEKELEKGCIRARRQMKRPVKLSRPVTERQVKAVAVHVVKRR